MKKLWFLYLFVFFCRPKDLCYILSGNFVVSQKELRFLVLLVLNFSSFLYFILFLFSHQLNSNKEFLWLTAHGDIECTLIFVLFDFRFLESFQSFHYSDVLAQFGARFFIRLENIRVQGDWYKTFGKRSTKRNESVRSIRFIRLVQMFCSNDFLAWNPHFRYGSSLCRNTILYKSLNHIFLLNVRRLSYTKNCFVSGMEI